MDNVWNLSSMGISRIFKLLVAKSKVDDCSAVNSLKKSCIKMVYLNYFLSILALLSLISF